MKYINLASSYMCIWFCKDSVQIYFALPINRTKNCQVFDKHKNEKWKRFGYVFMRMFVAEDEFSRHENKDGSIVCPL